MKNIVRNQIPLSKRIPAATTKLATMELELVEFEDETYLGFEDEFGGFVLLENTV